MITMSEDCDNKIIDEFIRNCENNKILIEEIKKGLDKKYDLEQFAMIKLDLTVCYPDTNDNIFKQLLRTKIAAQSLLNVYYYETNYENCSLSEAIIADSEHFTGKHYLSTNQTPDIEGLINILIRYMFLFQTLSQREIMVVTEICEYCDHTLGDDDIQCSICLADVFPIKLQKLYCSNNTKEDNVKPEKYEETPPDLWKCPACTYDNKLINEKCEICFEAKVVENATTKAFENIVETDKDQKVFENGTVLERSENLWPCLACTFQNKFENKCCEVCFVTRSLPNQETRDSHVLDSVELLNVTWNCEYCKRVYLYDKYMCEFCQEFDSSFITWICKKCTSCNDNNSKHCAVCGERNPSLKVCRKCNEQIDDTHDECEDCNSERRERNDRYNSSIYLSMSLKPSDSDNNDDWIIVEKFCIFKEGFKNSRDNLLASFGKSDSMTREFQSITSDWIDVKVKRCQSEKHDFVINEDNISAENVYYFNNNCCGTVKCNEDIYPCQCILNNGSNATEYKLVKVYDGDKYLKMCECTFGGEFNLNNNSMSAKKGYTCSFI